MIMIYTTESFKLFNYNSKFHLETCTNIKLPATIPTWTKVNRDANFHVALYYRSDIDDLLNASQQKVKHHNRRLRFRFQMYD